MYIYIYMCVYIYIYIHYMFIFIFIFIFIFFRHSMRIALTDRGPVRHEMRLGKYQLYAHLENIVLGLMLSSDYPGPFAPSLLRITLCSCAVLSLRFGSLGSGVYVFTLPLDLDCEL